MGQFAAKNTYLKFKSRAVHVVMEARRKGREKGRAEKEEEEDREDEEEEEKQEHHKLYAFEIQRNTCNA